MFAVMMSCIFLPQLPAAFTPCGRLLLPSLAGASWSGKSWVGLSQPHPLLSGRAQHHCAAALQGT